MRVLSSEETQSDLSFNKRTLAPRLLVWTHQNQCTVPEFSSLLPTLLKSFPLRSQCIGAGVGVWGRVIGELLAVQLSTLDLPSPLPEKLNLSHLQFPGKLKVTVVFSTLEYLGIIRQNVGFELGIN